MSMMSSKSPCDISSKIFAIWSIPILFFLYVLLIINTPSFLQSLWLVRYSSPVTESKWSPQVESSIRLSPPAIGVSCDRSHKIYDLCTVPGPTVVDPITSTFYTSGPATVQKIKAYPRKYEPTPMRRIQELTLISGPNPGPPCQAQHSNLPALVFSAGGYTGNFFHDFSEGFIPLFVTVKMLFPKDDFVLVISDARDWWLRKYADLLRSFTRHSIVVIGNRTDITASKSTHCFRSASLGLISHGMFTIDHNLIPGSLNLAHFRGFLKKTYGIGHGLSRGLRKPDPESAIGRRLIPKMVLVSRPEGNGRTIMNEGEVRAAAEAVGFEVSWYRPTGKTSLREAFRLMDSAHAMVGVHGAALTHMLFLRPGAAFVQVVPLGAESAAEVCYGSPAKAMGLEYVEYRVTAAESSLMEKYGAESLVVKDPAAYRGDDWGKMEVYLREQDVRVDVARFREYLEDAYHKALDFMRRNG